MASKKKLKKNKKDKIIFGVIGGLAEFWKIDPTLLRIGWLIILAFTGFVPGIITYFAASVIIPNK